MLEYVFIIVILIRGAGYLFDFIFVLPSFMRAPFAFLFMYICFIRCSFVQFFCCARLYSVHSFQPININTLTAAGEPPVDPRRVSIHNISVQLFYSAYFDSGA